MSDDQQHDDANESGQKERRQRSLNEETKTRGANSNARGLRQYFEEDEGSRMFMSEPSLTTEGDRTGDSQIFSYLLSPQNSLDDESVDEFAILSPPPPSAQHVASGSSPGNTSLSSRDSPKFQNKVLMQFMQDKRSRLKIESTPYGPAMLMTRHAPLQNEGTAKREERDKKKEHVSAPSSMSTSSVSIGQQLRAAEFLQELKIQSVGALQDASPSDYDSLPATQADRNDIDAVIRRHELSLGETGDSTIVMTLSDSEAEKEDDLNSTDFEQHNSADDEQTFERPKRVRRAATSAGKTSSPGHRRTRSGDSAAATLMNGGVDWKGMQDDNLIMPQSLDNDDDDDDGDDKDDNDERAPSPTKSRNIPPSRISSLMEERTSDGAPLFLIGSPFTKSRKTKKPPRQRRWKSDRLNGSNLSSGMMRTPVILPKSSLPHSFSGSSRLHASSFHQHHNDSQRRHELVQSPGDVGSNDGLMAQMHNSYPFCSSVPLIDGDSWSSLSQRHNFDANFSRQFSDSSASLDNFQSPASMFSWLSQESMSIPKSMYSSTEMESKEDILPKSNLDGVMGEIQDDGSCSRGEGNSSDTTESDIDDDDVNDEHHTSFQKMHASLRDGEFFRQSEELGAEKKSYQTIKQNGFHYRDTSPRQSKGSRNVFFKSASDRDPKQFPTFVCPKCGTLQRSFFTASTAPIQFEGPASYLALYFGVYVMASLCIFGLEEGWKGLDCIYFAVITLTTAGLGDLVPTSDSAKIVCSIFIYFGVACIGLLLGTYLAGMLDETSYKEAMKSRADNCVVCSRLKTSMIPNKRRSLIRPTNRRAVLRDKSNPIFASEKFTRATDAQENASQTFIEQYPKRTKRWHDDAVSKESEYTTQSFSPRIVGGQQRQGLTHPNSIPEFDVYNACDGEMPSPISPSPELNSYTIGSPMTTQILGRQRHTRHQSFDIPNSSVFATPASVGITQGRSTGMKTSSTVTPETQSFHESFVKSSPFEWHDDIDQQDNTLGDDTSTTTVDSALSARASSVSRIKTAKYVLLTLKQALVNSIAIIFIGGIGFYYIEKMTMVDSFYFTTVLLTTVGYGDIAPVTDGGKLFATIYVLVAGTVLLNNMSLISMIPLELRRRRIEKAVLTQFGDQLDDAALEELATGPLIHRLNLAAHNANGLNECTREMFALAMLVRLGKVTERDVRHTFAAFRRLDVDREGVLNSKTIISGKIKKHRSMKDLREGLFGTNAGANSSQPVQSSELGMISPTRARFWFGRKGSIHVEEHLSSLRPPVCHESSIEDLHGEQSALLGTSVSGIPLVGGTFLTRDHDEEAGIIFYQG